MDFKKLLEAISIVLILAITTLKFPRRGCMKKKFAPPIIWFVAPKSMIQD